MPPGPAPAPDRAKPICHGLGQVQHAGNSLGSNCRLRVEPEGPNSADEPKDAAAELIYHAYLLENMEDAVLAADDAFVLTAWNRGAQRMFGWTAKEALGRVGYELIPTSDDDEDVAEQIRELRATGRWRGEATFSAKDGSAVMSKASQSR